MPRATRYPQEIRERAVRMVFEQQSEHPSQWAAIRSVSDKFGRKSTRRSRLLRRLTLLPASPSKKHNRAVTAKGNEVRELRAHAIRDNPELANAGLNGPRRG